MRTPEQVKWDFVQQWLDRAGRDLATSEILLRAEFKITRMPASTLNRPQKNLPKPFSFGIRFHFQRATISLS
jgi:hypothetical protein